MQTGNMILGKMEPAVFTESCWSREVRKSMGKSKDQNRNRSMAFTKAVIHNVAWICNTLPDNAHIYGCESRTGSFCQDLKWFS